MSGHALRRHTDGRVLTPVSITLRLSSFGCVARRFSRSVTYLNTLIALAFGRLPENLKSFESGLQTTKKKPTLLRALVAL